MLTLIMIFLMSGCGAKNNEPVVAEGLPEFTVRGETDLPGNFFLSFVYSRNIIMLYYSYHDQTGAYDGYGLEGFAPGERVIGGRLALVAWCVYFLPVGILSFLHFHFGER